MLGGLSVLTWQGALAQADRRLRVTLTGPSPQAGILVQAPGGQTVLIDGGPSGSLLGQALGERLGPFTRHLDALVIAGASAEALSALPAAIDRFPPGLVVWAGEPGGTAAESRVRESLLDREVHPAQPGMRLDLGEGAQLRILGAPGSATISRPAAGVAVLPPAPALRAAAGPARRPGPGQPAGPGGSRPEGDHPGGLARAPAAPGRPAARRGSPAGRRHQPGVPLGARQHGRDPDVGGGGPVGVNPPPVLPNAPYHYQLACRRHPAWAAGRISKYTK